jgi:hypothetical protein
MANYYLDYLEAVAADDVTGLRKAEESYGDSWKKRGGVGAFMMLARKWDRIEQQVARTLRAPVAQRTEYIGVEPKEYIVCATPYDIFAHVLADPRPEGLLDDIRDLRRYLLLVEAELRAQTEQNQ